MHTAFSFIVKISLVIYSCLWGQSFMRHLACSLSSGSSFWNRLPARSQQTPRMFPLLAAVVCSDGWCLTVAWPYYQFILSPSCPFSWEASSCIRLVCTLCTGHVIVMHFVINFVHASYVASLFLNSREQCKRCKNDWVWKGLVSGIIKNVVV